MTNDTYLKVVECISCVRTLRIEMRPELRFKSDLGFESIDVVDFLFELERVFNVEFSLFELNAYIVEELNNETWDFTVQQVTEFVQRKIS